MSISIKQVSGEQVIKVSFEPDHVDGQGELDLSETCCVVGHSDAVGHLQVGVVGDFHFHIEIC